MEWLTICGFRHQIVLWRTLPRVKKVSSKADRHF